MILSGNYPFLVYVSNIFEPDSKVIFKVICHRFLSYYDSESKNFITETCEIPEDKFFCQQPDSKPYTHFMEHSVEAGDRIAFPLYFGDEYLEISLDLENGGPPTHYFQIVVGPKAKCYPNRELGKPKNWKERELPDDSYVPPEFLGPYSGGKWEIKKGETDWKLIIKKYGPDPETEPVEIGQSTPG